MRFGILEGAPSAPTPKDERLVSLFVPQSCRGFNQHAEDCGAIVVGQLDQPSFSDQAAKLDQLTRSLPAVYHPCPRIASGAASLEAIAF
jgi:hypothetical protein